MFTRRRLLGTAVAATATKWLVPQALAEALAPAPKLTAQDSPWDVRRFGAVGDGKTMDTHAVQAAIDACHQAGGGRVHFATGCTFLVGTIYLKDHIKLYVDTNATIVGSNNLGDYGSDVGLNPFFPETIDPCLIYAKGVVDIGLGGDGTIIGYTASGFSAPAEADARARKQRPMLIRLESCSQITITDITLRHCGSWCLHLKRSNDITLHNVRIHNEKQDGFDLESCQNVTISDCHLLECGDDAIAITTSARDQPSKNITITNCLMHSRWSAIRFGPLSKGDFEEITVSNCVFFDCNGGGLKLGTFEGGAIRNCLFDNIVMDQVIAPIGLYVATWPEIGSTAPNPPMMPPGKISGLQFRGIRVIAKPQPPNAHPDGNDGLFFHGHPQGLIENILLRDVSITLSGGGTAEQAARREIVDMDQIDYRKDGYWTDHKTTWGVPVAYGLYARHIQGLTLEDVRFELREPDARPVVFVSDCAQTRIQSFTASSSPEQSALIVARNCDGLQLSEVTPTPKAVVLLRLEGAKSAGIVLSGNDPRGFDKASVCLDGATEAAVLSR